MTEKRTCKICKKSLPSTQYSMREGYLSLTCNKCSQRQRNIRISATPDSYLRVVFNSAKHQATSGKRKKDWTLEVEDIFEIWAKQEGKCALSGVLMTYARDGQGSKDLNVSIDRIDPTLGYVTGNVQLVSYRVNLMKHTLTEDVFFWWVRNLYNFSC